MHEFIPRLSFYCVCLEWWMLIKPIVVIISHIHKSNHHASCLKFIQRCYVDSFSIKLEKIYFQAFYSFCCYCKWNCFFISLSHSLLLVYRNTTDFSMLILYPATLLSLILLVAGVLVESLGFYVFFWSMALRIWEDERALGLGVCLRGFQTSWETGTLCRVAVRVAPEDRRVAVRDGGGGFCRWSIRWSFL